MSKDDWKAVYAKDDDLKLTKAGGNKIRRTTTPPIFSSGMLEYTSNPVMLSRKETVRIINTKHMSIFQSRHLG